MRRKLRILLAMLPVPVVIAVAGCGGRVSATNISNTSALSIQAAATHIDTNRTTRFTATLAGGEAADVRWSVSGGDPRAGSGSISKDGIYTPPSYLTRDSVDVSVSAVLASSATQADSEPETARLTVTPGFLQPLTPGNLSVGPAQTVTITGSTTEVGGSGGIRFTLASDTTGTPSTAGSLSGTHCVRGAVEGSNPSYTVCSVTYTAPAAISASEPVYVLGTISGSSSDSSATSPTLSWTRVLVNAAGINSNPASHQARLSIPVELGSSSGSNVDYDSSQGQLSDCCGGTLGALLQDTSGNQYVLSNNHVFARSDQAIPGETIIQPGLIDNACTPYGVGSGTTPVAALTGYPSLSSQATNVDAAIARVTTGLVDPKGNILELGAKQADGTLAAAPPGTSSTGGKGEAASLGMMVAKSGRTTGLTCAAVSAVDVDVTVDYFTDCAETNHSISKTFTNQIAVAGPSFSDAGDSGALVVDAANAEPIGLFFAGGTDTNGVEHAIANPVSDVLSTLDSRVPGSNGPTSYTFTGGADHPVSCLSYGSAKTASDPVSASTLSIAERERLDAALPQAQLFVNQISGPLTGIARVGVAASKDRPDTGAIVFYVEPAVLAQTAAAIPAFINGVPTIVRPANSKAAEILFEPRSASLSEVRAVKQHIALSLMKSNRAIFGVGVGQSVDNPADAALILFADRRTPPTSLPESTALDGVRLRIILMDRLHVTRSHGSALGPTVRSAGNCLSSRRLAPDDEDREPLEPRLPEDKLQLPE